MKCVIVVPARGGSKGIPRKNLRMLAGRPLIYYAIKAATAVPNAEVVVSTDDEEIADVASSYGALIVKRPARLAEDDVTLDAVIVHAVVEYERRTGTRIPLVVTVQPTSPLVSPATIQSAIAVVEHGRFDSCVGVVDARHLYWIEDEGSPAPLYSERQNRQWLPPMWKETGSVVVSSRRLLDGGARIGGRVGLVKVPEGEAVDIDSWDDWVVAESRLLAPRIAIRVTGDERTGLGHAYRALTLAGRLPSPWLTVAVNAGSALAMQLIARANYRVVAVADDAAFIHLLESERYDLVINDVLDTSTEYMSLLRDKHECAIVNFEDLGPGARYADLVINALYEYSTPLPNQRCGWQYVCLRDEFMQHEPLPSLGSQSHVLVSFGGTDPNNLTARAIRAVGVVASKIPGLTLRVVVGPGNHRVGEYERLLKVACGEVARYDVVRNAPRMARIMSEATVAITSNGRTVFELAALGVPMVTISQNAREATHTFARLSGGALDLGIADGVVTERIAEAVEHLLVDRRRLEAMRANLLHYDLRSGTSRVVEEIMQTYRRWKESRSADTVTVAKEVATSA